MFWMARRCASPWFFGGFADVRHVPGLDPGPRCGGALRYFWVPDQVRDSGRELRPASDRGGRYATVLFGNLWRLIPRRRNETLTQQCVRLGAGGRGPCWSHAPKAQFGQRPQSPQSTPLAFRAPPLPTALHAQLQSPPNFARNAIKGARRQRGSQQAVRVCRQRKSDSARGIASQT